MAFTGKREHIFAKVRGIFLFLLDFSKAGNFTFKRRLRSCILDVPGNSFPWFVALFVWVFYQQWGSLAQFILCAESHLRECDCQRGNGDWHHRQQGEEGVGCKLYLELCFQGQPCSPSCVKMSHIGRFFLLSARPHELLHGSPVMNMPVTFISLRLCS